jgi:Icc protein
MTASTSRVDRRQFMGVVAAASAVGTLTGRSSAQTTLPAKAGFRFAHFTDIHVFAERRAPEGFTAALKHVHSPEQAAQMIVTGGDLVFDSSETSLGVARDRWDLFLRIMKEHCTLPVHHCLGNHDVWGWCHSKCGSNGSESEFGTGLAKAQLKLNRDFQSFDAGGWHFILLNSIEPDPSNECGYLARIGAEQLAWLEKDLAATTLPTVVVSHAPIMSISAGLSGKSLATSANVQQINGGLLHLDGPILHQAFRKSGRVKLVLSGHMHQIDRCEAHGITYCCDGAVCGGWWKIDAAHASPSYALIDLFPDGSFHHRMVDFGWVNVK